MIGGGVLAHTLIGASRDADSDSSVNYLVLDPHYTGKDELKTIIGKGWVGWKDNNFWSKKDFYNMCMPLLPATIWWPISHHFFFKKINMILTREN